MERTSLKDRVNGFRGGDEEEDGEGGGDERGEKERLKSYSHVWILERGRCCIECESGAGFDWRIGKI